MDDIVGLLALALHWGPVLGLLAGAALGFVLAKTIAAFSGLQGIALALMGMMLGAWVQDWIGRKKTGVAKPAPGKTSMAAAVGISGIAGATWGALSATSIDALLVGLVFLVGGLACWLLRLRATERAARSRFAVICGTVVLGGYGLGGYLAFGKLG